MSHTDDLSYWLLKQVIMADEPLAHPSLEDVPDSVVRDQVRSMLDRGLVEGELHTTPEGRWIVYPGLRITLLGRSYLSRHIETVDGTRRGPNASSSDRRAKEALPRNERRTGPLPLRVVRRS